MGSETRFRIENTQSVGTDQVPRGMRARLKALAMATTALIVLGLSVIAPRAAVASGLGTQEIWNLHSGYCLSAPNKLQGASAQIEQETCTDTTNRLWDVIAASGVPIDCTQPSCIQQFWVLQNEYSHLCLDVYQQNYSDGAKVVQWPCNQGDPGQQFVLSTSCGSPPSDYWIAPLNDLGYRVEIAGASTSIGGKADLWAPNVGGGATGGNQCWWNYPG